MLLHFIRQLWTKHHEEAARWHRITDAIRALCNACDIPLPICRSIYQLHLHLGTYEEFYGRFDFAFRCSGTEGLRAADKYAVLRAVRELLNTESGALPILSELRAAVEDYEKHHEAILPLYRTHTSRDGIDPIELR